MSHEELLPALPQRLARLPFLSEVRKGLLQLMINRKRCFLEFEFSSRQDRVDGSRVSIAFRWPGELFESRIRTVISTWRRAMESRKKVVRLPTFVTKPLRMCKILCKFFCMKRSLPPLKLRNSPLVYVIAQTRVSPVISIEKFVPDIQEQLRHQGFPRFQKGRMQEVRFDLDSAPKMNLFDRYEFQNKEGTSGIVLASNFISLHTSKYDVYERFEETLKTALSIVHEVVQFNLVERIGLRYVDLIRLGHDETWGDYLQPGLLGLDPATLGVRKSLSRFEFVGRTEVGKLVVRYAQSDQGTILPPDLVPSPLQHDVQFTPNELVAFLDLDHFSELSRDFDVSAVVAIVGELHDNLDRAFRSAVTETALLRWGREATT